MDKPRGIGYPEMHGRQCPRAEARQVLPPPKHVKFSNFNEKQLCCLGMVSAQQKQTTGEELP